MTVRIIVIALLVAGPLWAQQAPSATFSFSDVEGTAANGVGTLSLEFTGGEQIGTLSLALTPNLALSSSPFLLGKVDFLPGSTFPATVTFQMSLDVFGDQCEPTTVNFGPKITFSQFTEPGYQEQQAIFSKDTPSRITLDGTEYTFGFAGVSTSAEFDPNGGDTIAAVLGNGPSSAYLFGQLSPMPSLTPPENCGCDNCHCPPPGVPEPATGLLLGVAATIGLFLRRRSAV